MRFLFGLGLGSLALLVGCSDSFVLAPGAAGSGGAGSVTATTTNAASSSVGTGGATSSTSSSSSTTSSSSASTGSGGGDACEETVWDAFDDYQVSANPGDVWEYGRWNGTNIPFNNNTTYNGMTAWRSDQMDFPYLVRNGTGQEQTLAGGEIVFPADTYLHLHPSDTNDAYVGWTAPAAGEYDIEVGWTDLNTVGGAQVEIFVYRNEDGLLTQQQLFTLGGSGAWNGTQVLGQGEEINVYVDSFNGMAYDSTGVSLTVSRVCP